MSNSRLGPATGHMDCGSRRSTCGLAAVAVGLLLAVVSLTGPLGAQPATPGPGPAGAPTASAGEAPPAGADPAKLQEAKRLFKAGNELRKAGDWQRALEAYMKSRELVPSVPNTWNAAICLGKLGRADEALELYEKLLTTFRDKLGDADYQTMVGEMNRLRSQVGGLDVRANVDGFLVIDGRARGKLPLFAPVRVLPGKRTVRIMKDGYEPYEATVTVKAGQTESLDARLAPLAAAGRLRVEQTELAGADLYIDGALVGQVPWEGTLAPGTHLFFVRTGDVGSAPQAVVVVQGQTVLASAKVSPLGPEIRLLVTPPTAELTIDGVVVGKGRWQGRLPVGEHQLEAREEGYFVKSQPLRIDESTSGDIPIRLQADPDHARWGVGTEGEVWFDVFGGLGLAPSLRSDAENRCTGEGCDEDATALGFLGGARVGYEFPFGLSLEAAGGYAYLHKGVTRQKDVPYSAGTTTLTAHYTIEDSIVVSGAFAAGGVGYRRLLGEHLQLRSHVLVGALFTSAKDDVTGDITVGADTRPVSLQGGGESVSSVDLMILPEMTLGARFGGFSFGVGLAMGFFVLEGPTYDTGDLVVESLGCGDPMHVDCAPGQSFLREERSYGPMIVFLPTVNAGYAF